MYTRFYYIDGLISDIQHETALFARVGYPDLRRAGKPFLTGEVKVTMTKLIMTRIGKTRETVLNPKGTTLGRGNECDVVIDDAGVSRVHARIYQDPFGRWIIEDLDSRNGVIVDGKRVKAQAILPGQQIMISFCTLTLKEENDERTKSGMMSLDQISVIDEGTDDDIVSYRPGKAARLSPARVQHLNDFTTELMELSSPAELYSQACGRLASMLKTLVAIVRLPAGSVPIPDIPEILACHFADEETSGDILSRTSLNLSRKVLDAVRSDTVPVMAGSGTASDRDMKLTVIDNFRPHVVFAARVNDIGDSVDVLYLDILESRSPLELFDFVEAAARQINFIQKNLIFIELEKNEKALREANIQLREKDRIKDEYVSRVTHDIKGHLAAIQSCLYVASSESTGPLNEKQADFLGRAVARNVQLTGFVKELLHLTRMRLSGQSEMEEFSLEETVAASLETVAPKAEDKSITLTSEVVLSSGSITGDRFSINEMITNLLFNAVKYTPEGKTVHLAAMDEKDGVRIEISDTGIGIPEDEIDNVFEEFFRATNAKKSEKDGTGLGLSLVKQIVERHGGSISVSSEEGRGSTFTVMLPSRSR